MHVCIFIYTYVYIYVCVYKYVQTYIMYISCQICLEPTEMYLLRIFAIQSHNNKKLHQLTRTDALSLSFNRGHNDVQETSDLSVEGLDSMSDGCADGFPSSEKH